MWGGELFQSLLLDDHSFAIANPSRCMLKVLNTLYFFADEVHRYISIEDCLRLGEKCFSADIIIITLLFAA